MSTVKKENQTTRPIFIGKLHEKMGARETADYLGCSPEHIRVSLKNDSVSLCWELAAENIFEKKYGEKADGQCAIIHAPPHVCKTIGELVKNLGGKFHIVP